MGEVLKDQAGHTDEALQPTSEPSGMSATATQFGRHYPLYAVAAAFSGGMIAGWLIAHELKTRLYARGEQRQRKTSEGKAYKRAISRWEGEGGSIPSTKKGGKK